ncbi:hypothetical protein [Nocardioides sp.]|uniref:hypothetical protein n=1 Tax=Nocardioides sp. TaxID=35761 RepID=UPI003511FDDD
MFGFGIAEVVVALLLVGAVALGLLLRDPVVTVDDEMSIDGMSPAELDRRVFGRLGAVRRSQMGQVFPGHVALTSSSIPGWAILVGLLTFPVGLLLLLLIRQQLSLHVRVLPDGRGSLVQVAGKARKSVALEVGRIVSAEQTALPAQLVKDGFARR